MVTTAKATADYHILSQFSLASEQQIQLCVTPGWPGKLKFYVRPRVYDPEAALRYCCLLGSFNSGTSWPSIDVLMFKACSGFFSVNVGSCFLKLYNSISLCPEARNSTFLHFC